MKRNQQFDYSEFDKILKENPDVTLKEFQEKWPEIGITTDRFYSRRAFLNGTPYKHKRFTKEIKRSLPKTTTSASSSSLRDVIAEYRPTSKYVKEYQKLGPIFVKNPSTTYSEIKKEVTMTDCDFYCFRKFVLEHLNGSSVKTKTGKRAYNKKDPDGNTRQYKRLYRTIMELPSGTYPKGFEEPLQRVFTELNRDSVSRQVLELIEKTFPRPGLEIRVYPRR